MMYEILIYLCDDNYRKEVSDFSENSGYGVTIVADPGQAVRNCAEEWFDLVLVWAADHRTTAEFLNELHRRRLNFLPVVALIDNRDEFEKILSLEITDYILLPLPRDEFRTIIRHIIEDLDLQSTVMEGMNWQGSLEEYNLIDLIQMIDESNNDAELTLSYGRNSGAVYFKEGKLAHAQTSNDLKGEFALHKLTFWSKGNFQIQFSGRFLVRESIQSNNQEILLTLAHDLLEWDQAYRGLPDLFVDVLANPLVEPVNISSVQKEILKKCKNPITIFDLIFDLRHENKVLLQEIKGLFESNMLGRKTDVEKQIIQERQGKGLSQFINAFSSVFRKKPEIDEERKGEESPHHEAITPTIQFRRLWLKEEEKDKIRRKIEALA